jgi:SAM-dependent methyltransferase
MLRPPLVECRFLDPRPAAEAARAPIVGAVNMPRSELPARTHELPPRDELIRVVGPPEFAEPAVAWLTSAGRRAAVESAFEYAPPADARPVGRLWRPTAFLAEVCARLSPGRALELACGTGRDAVYLAACGWQVLAVDVLPDALERGQMLAQRCAPALAPVEWRQADLERGVLKLPAGFDLVVAVRYLHRPLFARLPDWLRPGGSFVCETFTTVHRARHGRPARTTDVLRPGELTALLAGFELRHCSEAWHGPLHTARAWAVRAG